MRRLVPLWLLLGGVLAPATTESPPAPAAPRAPPAASLLAPSGFDPSRVLVGLEAGPAGRGPDLLRREGLRPEREVEGLGLQFGLLPHRPSEEELAVLRRRPGIAFAEPDRLVAAATTPSDPLLPAEDVIATLGLPAAWSTTLGSPDVVIAVLDTGIDETHPDLSGRLVPGWNVLDGNADTSDPNGHGTGMAGLLAAGANDGVGMAGVCPGCRLMPVRVAGADGQAPLSAIADGLTWAANHGARVALVAFGNLSGSPAVQSAAQYFQSLGGVVVAAEGNLPGDTGQAKSPYLLNVGGTGSGLAYGRDLCVTAPTKALCTAPGGGYAPCEGSSVAAALAAGVVGLEFSAAPALTPEKARALLEEGAWGGNNQSVYYATQVGWGAVRADYSIPLASALAAGSRESLALHVFPQPPVRDVIPRSASISGEASTSSPLQSVTLYNDFTNTLLATASASPFTFAFDTSNFSGPYVSLRIDLRTVSGGLRTIRLSPSVDNIAPTVTISSPAANSTVSGWVRVFGSMSDNFDATTIPTFVAHLGGASCNAPSYLGYCYLNTLAVDGSGNRLVPDGPATLVVNAADSAGNPTVVQVPVTVSNPVGIGFASPTGLVPVTGVVPVTLAAWASGAEVQSVTLQAGSATVGTLTAPPYSFSWDSAAQPGSLSATVTDTLGRTAQASLSVAAENPARAPSLLGLTNNGPLSGVRSLQVVTANGSAPLAWDLLVDGALAQTVPSNGQTSAYLFWSTYSVPEGAHTLQVVEHRPTGAAVSSATFTVVVNHTPPALALTSPAPGTTFTDPFTVTAEAPAVNGLASARLYVNGQLQSATCTASPCTWSVDVTRFPSGPATLLVIAQDKAGNYATDSRAVSFDNSRPVVTISSPAPGGTRHGVVPVSVSASSSHPPITQVVLKVDSTVLATLTDAPYDYAWDTSALSTGNHTLSATATDGINHSTTAQVQVSVDNTPPVVAITSPQSGAWVAGGAVNIALSASDSSGIASSTLAVDGVTFRSGSGYSTPYFWNSTSVADGPHTLTFTATDPYGQTASASVPLNVDNTPPTGSITSPAPGATVYGTLTATATASDGSGVSQVLFSIDSANTVQVRAPPYQASLDTTQFLRGNHTLRATVYDRAGNVTPLSETIYVDNSPPTVVITSPTSGAAVNGAAVPVQASVTSGAPITACTFYVGGVVVATTSGLPCSFSWNTASYPSGSSQLLQVTARSSVGSANNTLGVTVDHTAPAVAFGAPAAGALVRGAAVPLSVTASDSVGLAQVAISLDQGPPFKTGSGPLSTTWDTTSVSDGSHTLTATATDRAGNTASATRSVTVDNAPPTASFTAPDPGASLSGTATVTVAATDNLQVAAVDLSLDGSPWQTLTPPQLSRSWDTTGVSDGPHTLSAVARDSAGNASAVATRTVSVDNTAPAVSLASPAPGAWLRGVAHVSVLASDGQALASVRLSADGVTVGTSSSPNPGFDWDTRGLADGSHTLSATATDAAGNTATASVAVNVDNTPPQVALTSPADGASLAGTVSLAAAASDGQGIARVEFGLDGSSLASVTTAPYTWAWDTRSAPQGAHTLSATATDLSGNTTRTSVTVSVDNLAPTISFGSPAEGDHLRGQVAVALGASDDLSLAGVDLALDGASLASWAGAPGSYSWDTTHLAQGPHTLTATATDRAGNAAQASVTVRVDNQPPQLAFTTPSAGAYVSGSVPVALAASDDEALAGVALTLDGSGLSAWASGPYTLAWDSTSVADGLHTLGASASDLAGNGASASETVYVDNAPPTVALTSPASGASVRGSVAVAADASDNAGIVRVDFAADGTVFASATAAPYAASWDSDPLAEGPHTLSATATDLTGHTATHTRSVTVDRTPPSVAFARPATGAVLRGVQTVEVAASDAVGVTRVELRLDGSLKATLTQPPYTWTSDTAAWGEGPHLLEARAVDGAGNSAQATVAVVADNLLPTVAITSPAPGTPVRGLISVTVAASDANAVAQVSLSAGGVPVGTLYAAPYTFSWDTSGLSGGSLDLVATAADAAGNTSQSAVTVRVDNAPPVVAFTAPAAGSLVTGPVPVQGTVSDDGAVASVSLRVDGAVVQTLAAAPYLFSWNSAAAADGPHTLSLLATDAAGNSGSASQTLTVDNTAPGVSFLSPSAGAAVKGTVPVQVGASDDHLASVALQVDGTTLQTLTAAPFSFTWNTASAVAGSHTLTAVALDALGHRTAVSETVVVDNTLPSVSITTPTPGKVVKGTIPVGVSASDNLAVASVTYLVDGVAKGTLTAAPYTFSWNTATSPNGLHTLTATAVDTAGNSKTSAGVSVTVKN